MGWHLGVGVERKAVDTSAARTRECGTFPFITKSRANPSNVLSGPLPTGDALLDRGGHGASELGLVVAQGIIACGHGGVDARLQWPWRNSLRWRRVDRWRRVAEGRWQALHRQEQGACVALKW